MVATYSSANEVPYEDWLSVTSLSQVARDVFKNFTHKPDFRIIDRVDDVGLSTADDGEPAGFVMDQRIHLVRSGIESADFATDTVWHELLHFGLRRVMTREQYISELGKLYATEGD